MNELIYILKKENFDDLINWDIKQIILPIIRMADIDEFLIFNYNDWERIEFWSDKNWRDLDFWFYFPLKNWIQLCVSWSVWNKDYLVVTIDNDSKELWY